MKNRSLIFGIAMIVCTALIFSGCESPTDGSSGAAGAAGPIYLSGPQTSAGIQDALDSGAPVIFAGVEQSDNGQIIVPAGKGVKLVGDAAYSIGSGVTATLVLTDANSIDPSSTGKIAKGTGGGTSLTVIAPEALKAKTAADVAASFIAIQSGATIKPAATFAVSGNITISDGDTSTTNIKNSELSGTTALYVIGNLTVSKPIGQAATVAVLGSATVNDVETAAVKWLVSGTLTATKAPTAVAGTITTETLNVTGAGATIALSGSGAVEVGELVTAGTVTITTGTGGLTAGKVTGAAVFADSAVITEADFASTAKFAGTATLGDVSFVDDVTITDAKALTLKGEAAFAGAKSIKVGTDNILTAGSEGASLVGTSSDNPTLAYTSSDKTLTVAAKAASIKGAFTVPAGVTLKADSVALTIDAEASLVLTGAAGTDGAKLNGSGTGGKVVAAKTEITGIWQAVGEGAVAITAASDVSVIAASADTVLTAGTGGTITQGTGANNNLMIAADTTIDLKGTLAATDIVVGTIKLSESTTADQGGKLTLLAATSVIKVGGDTDGTALGTAGGAFVTTAATGKITVLAFADVKVLPGTGANAIGKVNTIKGGTAAGTLQAFGGAGGTGTVDIKAGTATT